MVFSCDGNVQTGSYSMRINGKLTNVYCDNGTIVLLRRRDGSENFNRKWEDYAEGFGDMNNEFWFGLRYVHALTSAWTYRVRFDMRLKDGTTRYAEYATFKVENEADKFRLRLGSYSGDAGDDFNKNPQNGMQFTTVDSDNDNSIGNCAEKRSGGGFWFYDCFRVHLTGKYHPDGTSAFAKGIHWESWTGDYKSLTFVEMKMWPA